MLTFNRHIVRFAVSFLIVAGHLVTLDVLARCSLPQQRQVRKVATSTVSGRVTNNGKGRAGIVVGLRATRGDSESVQTYKGVSDVDGNYRITNIPAGNYRIAPVSPNYVVTDFGRFMAMGKTLILAEGENVEGIDFAVIKGAVVTGRITDIEGRPVADESVHVVQADQDEEQRPPYTNFTTDDRGIYRVFGLSPGRYKVFVGDSADAVFSSVMRGRTAYPRTYYADATKPELPRILELAEGAEATNIDITVSQAKPGFSASAVVVDSETNRPVPGGRFSLQRLGNDTALYGGATSLANMRGELRFDNLAPGKYGIVVMPEIGSELFSERKEFDVVDQDVSGLVVKVGQGAVVSGMLVVEGPNDKTVLAKLSQARLIAYVQGGPRGGNYGRSANIGADGSFRVGGLGAGTVNFQVISPGQRSDELAIARVERDGVVEPRGLRIKTREQVSGVKLVIVTGSGTVTGSFKLENGPAPPGTRFLVRLQKPGERAVGGRPHEIDARGHFVINNVPAGTYDIILTGYIPESHSRPPMMKQSITVTEGAVTQVELSLDLNAPPPTVVPQQP